MLSGDVACPAREAVRGGELGGEEEGEKELGLTSTTGEGISLETGQ